MRTRGAAATTNTEATAETHVMTLIEETTRVRRATRHGTGSDRVLVLGQQSALLVAQGPKELLVRVAGVIFVVLVVTTQEAGQQTQAHTSTWIRTPQAATGSAPPRPWGKHDREHSQGQEAAARGQCVAACPPPACRGRQASTPAAAQEQAAARLQQLGLLRAALHLRGQQTLTSRRLQSQRRRTHRAKEREPGGAGGLVGMRTS